MSLLASVLGMFHVSLVAFLPVQDHQLRQYIVRMDEQVRLAYCLQGWGAL